MVAQQRTEAYDLSLFEPKRQEWHEQKDNIVVLPQEQLEKNRRQKVQPLRLAANLFCMAAVVSIVTAIVFSQVQLTELTDQVNTAAAQLEESESVYTQLKMRSDAQYTLQTVEDYAKDTLGMQKINQNQVTCVSLSEGDEGEVLQQIGGNWWDSLWNWLQNLLA